MRQWGFYLGLKFPPPRHYVHGSPPSSSLSNDAEALLSAYSFAYNIIINWCQELNAALRKDSLTTSGLGPPGSAISKPRG